MRKSALLIIVSSLSMLALTACNFTPDYPAIKVSRLTHWSKNEVRLNCGQATCPESVGAVIFVTRFSHEISISRCTGSLIGRRAVLTNSHCDGVNAFAEGYFFLNVAGETKYYRISGAIYDSMVPAKPDGHDPDLAVLSLQDAVYDVSPLKISRQIPTSMSSLVGYVVDDSEHLYKDLTLNKRICQTVDEDIFVDGGVREESIGLSLFSCPIIPGNSGGPMFVPGDLSHIQVVVNLRIEATLKSGAELTFAMGNRIQCMALPFAVAPDRLCQHPSGKKDSNSTSRPLTTRIESAL